MTPEKEKLLLENIGLAVSTAVKFARTKNLDLKELIQVGITGTVTSRSKNKFSKGLLGAVMIWKGEEHHGCAFSTFAVPRIWSALVRAEHKNFVIPPAFRRRRADVTFFSDIDARGEPGQYDYMKGEGPDITVQIDNKIDIENALEKLPERTRYVIRKGVLEGESQTQLGLSLGLSKNRVGQIYKMGIRKLRASHALDNVV